MEPLPPPSARLIRQLRQTRGGRVAGAIGTGNDAQGKEGEGKERGAVRSTGIGMIHVKHLSGCWVVTVEIIMRRKSNTWKKTPDPGQSLTGTLLRSR